MWIWAEQPFKILTYMEWSTSQQPQGYCEKKSSRNQTGRNSLSWFTVCKCTNQVVRQGLQLLQSLTTSFSSRWLTKQCNCSVTQKSSNPVALNKNYVFFCAAFFIPLQGVLHMACLCASLWNRPWPLVRTRCCHPLPPQSCPPWWVSVLCNLAVCFVFSTKILVKRFGKHQNFHV